MRNPLWLRPDALVLASGSSARRGLLQAAMIPHEARPAGIDECAVEQPLRASDALPADIARHLAAAKAKAVSAAAPSRLVLGADQTLSLGGTMFVKPDTPAEACRHLEALSGRTHCLHSAVALCLDGAVLFETVVEARLTMRDLSPAFIAAYLEAEGGEVCSTVGAYRLEGLGIHLFERIEGDHATILGLPLLPVLDVLRREGALAA